RFPVSKASTRVREQNEITGGRQRHPEVAVSRPRGLDGGAGAAVHGNDERMLLSRIETGGVYQPAPPFECIGPPIDTPAFAPCGPHVIGELGNLFPAWCSARPDLWCVLK